MNYKDRLLGDYSILNFSLGEPDEGWKQAKGQLNGTSILYSAEVKVDKVLPLHVSETSYETEITINNLSGAYSPISVNIALNDTRIPLTSHIDYYHPVLGGVYSLYNITTFFSCSLYQSLVSSFT
jgi:hypothetical protein